MLSRAIRSVLGTLLTGVVAFLPLMLTVVLLSWAGETLQDYFGPGSRTGAWLRRLGFSVVEAEEVAYAAGVLLMLLAFWVTGLLVRANLLGWGFGLLEKVVHRIPLVGAIYGLAGRFAKLLEPHKGTDLHAMTPVWCLFGGQGGVAVLALMPSAEIVEIEGTRYRPVLVPSAPVPVGGGLLFLPVDWVVPAQLGIEELTSLYVSMGVALPPKLVVG